MEYTKIEVSFAYAPKRLNRTIAIREDVDLLMLGAIIGESFNVDFEHYYLFRDCEHNYYVTDWIEDENDLAMMDFTLSEMDDHFTYVYDTGENYEFNVQKLNTTYKYHSDELGEDPIAFVVDGNGQGIFENDIYSLYAYLDGEIDSDFDDEERHLPYNLDINSFEEFDDPIDIEEYVFNEFDIHQIALEQDSQYNYENYDDYEYFDDEDESNYLIDILAGALIHKIEDEDSRNQKLYNKYNELNDMHLEDHPYEIMTAIAFNSAIEMLIEDSDEYIDRIIDNLDKIFND